MTTFAHRLQYGLVRGVIWSLERVPLETARRAGEAIGRLGYRPLRIRRRVVERQLAAAFPGLSQRDVASIALAAYAHFGRLSIELALLSNLGTDGVLSLFEADDDFGVIERRVADGKGLVFCTGHVGNWELAAAYVAARGIPVDVVVRRMNNPLFDAYLTRTRERAGLRVLYDADSVRHLLRSYRQGRALGLVADQGVMGLASTYVPFFGRPAKTPRGPAVFALRFKTAPIFAAAMLQPSGKYRFFVREIPLVDTGDREADVDTMVMRFSAQLEAMVRRFPEQYFWHHRRWKRQPPDTPKELREPV